jgi:uncharacterized repeat protein (TIGR03987 family)
MMPQPLLNAVILFTIALVFYTTGVWGERLRRELKPWHIVVFSLGVFTDALATWVTYKFIGALVFTPHAIFGFIALFLMTFHFIWSILVISGTNEKSKARFHRFSIFAWGVWMFSYLTGFALGIGRFI